MSTKGGSTVSPSPSTSIFVMNHMSKEISSMLTELFSSYQQKDQFIRIISCGFRLMTLDKPISMRQKNCMWFNVYICSYLLVEISAY